MDLLYNIFLLIHIISGNCALVAGAVVLISRKGNRFHRMLGRIFFYSILLVSITAIVLSIYKKIPFLFYIGIFVFYQNYAGYRSVKNKSLLPDWKDVLVLLLALSNGMLMFLSHHPVLIFFASISLFLGISDLNTYRKLYRKQKLKKLSWLSRHLGMMIGAYIGAFTAFLVVNIKAFQPFWLIWVAPSFLFVPLIIYWTKKYTVKTLIQTKK